MPKDDGQDKLSEATGIPRKELDGIWRDVKDNHKRLADCSGPHEFEPDPTDRRPILKRHVCKKCGAIEWIVTPRLAFSTTWITWRGRFPPRT